MECANKGICNRKSGQCQCYPGYTGSACQRTDCPVTAPRQHCSGHGMCYTLRDIATFDNNNSYSLWDADATMGCSCDNGYEGTDCSLRSCKAGADPLFQDEYNNIRYSNFTYMVYTTDSTKDIVGNYKLVFYDWQGHPWLTDKIELGATCLNVITALETIPNNIIRNGTILCQENPYKSTALYPTGQSAADTRIPIYSALMYIKILFTLAFPGNPGKLKQPDISIYNDGERPTLYAPGDMTAGMTHQSASMGYAVFPNGFAGDDIDMVSDYCSGVLVRMSAVNGYNQLVFTSTTDMRLFKSCLGGSDADNTNNVEKYNWDHGSSFFSDPTYTTTKNKFLTNPHLIKLVDATPDLKLDKYGETTGAVVDRLSTTLDDMFQKYPRVELCDKDYYTTAAVDATTATTCTQRTPPGFYVVVYYDAVDDVFRLVSNAPHDYASSTYFHVFTTTGYLQLVTPYAFATTVNSGDSFSTSAASLVHTYHANTVYLMPTLLGASAQSGYTGGMDCGSHPMGVLDCLDKGDLVMLLNTDLLLATDLSSLNPIYPNIYTVQKIEESPSATPPTGTYSAGQEITRHRLTLDYGVNRVYDTAGAGTNGAAVYKFHPPAGFTYVGECANRGNCNYKTGLCACFRGYTGETCTVLNAASK